MNEEMVKVVDWLQINRLSLNLNKTHFIVCHRKRAKISLSADLTINKIKIGMAEKTKSLEVIIDQNLSFQSLIIYIKGKVARGIGILYKNRPYFSLETMRMLYNAFVYPYFTYCIEVWVNTYQSYLEPQVQLQKRAIRTIAGARKYEHSLPLLYNLKLLNIKEIYIYCVQLLMYKYHHLQSIFSDFYVHEVHEYHTRQENLLHVPLIRTAPLSKRILVITATNRNGQNLNGHKPKRPQIGTATDRNSHKAERPQTGTATNRNGHKPERPRPQTGTATNRNGHRPERPQTGMATNRNRHYI